MAPAPESPATISPDQTEDTSRLSSSSWGTPSPKRQHYPDACSPSVEKKRKQADNDSGAREVETPKQAKIRKVESPPLLEQDQVDLFMAHAIAGPKKDESTPLFRRPSLCVSEDGCATNDCEEAKVNPSASSSPSDLAFSTKERLYAKSAISIKEEADCTKCTTVIESLHANFQLYTALLRKEGAQDNSFTLWAAAHQQTLDAVSAVHQANHVKVKSE